MNKSFFVVFLGIILGAMALIVFNQTSRPVTVVLPTEQADSATAGQDGGAPASGPETGTTTVAAAQPPLPEPTPAKPETPAMPAPEAPQPAPLKPEIPAPEVPKPEATAAATPGADAPNTAVPPPVVATPVVSKPEAPKPATSQPAAPKPEEQKPEAPKPVTAVPETRANPGGEPVKKSLTLVNIGLHFKGGGMALRIEADAPFSYKTFALPSPDRYVIDLVGTWNKMRAPNVPANNMIKAARAGTQPGGPRLVLDMLRAPKKHNVTWISPTVLEIVIE